MKLQTKHPSKKPPAKIVGPNGEETAIAQKPSVAEDKEERNGLTEQQNSENQTVKEWSKGLTKIVAARKRSEHMEVMQARLTALEPNDWPLTTPSLLVVNRVR